MKETRKEKTPNELQDWFPTKNLDMLQFELKTVKFQSKSPQIHKCLLHNLCL